jgi:hypothetical protein
MHAKISGVQRTLLVTGILMVAWASSIALGMRLLESSQNVAVHRGLLPMQFPRASALCLAADRPTLVTIVQADSTSAHATLRELAQVMIELHGKANAYVVFSPATATSNGWDVNGLWSEAEKIPGVTPVGDNDGTETQRFGGESPRRTLVFAPDGRLVFKGGSSDAVRFAANDLTAAGLCQN